MTHNDSEYAKKYRESHKEQIKEYMERTKDKRKEYNKKHYIEHRKEYILKTKTYREENKERVKESRHKYYINNKDIVDLKCKTKSRGIKEITVTSHGGHCVICGYDRCIAALEFHHVIPGEKDTQVYRNVSEADKCVLLCSNCHKEHHFRGLSYET